MKKLVLFIVIFLLSCGTIDKNYLKVNDETTINHVSFVACGDNLIHHTIYESGFEHGFLPMYEKIKPYIKKHDLAFINQETILGGKEVGLSSYPRFNSPYEVGDALVDAGFNLISLANNHTLDRGEIAIKNSLSYWQKQPVIYSGSESENKSHMKVFTKNDIVFAFIAYTYGTNGIPFPAGKEYLVNLFDYEKARIDIENIKDKVDIIIVSMHWGDEYQSYPNKEQVAQANFLASLGVDIIIGHHPHVIQPFDIINMNGKNTYVIYSLGNFLSDQKGIDRLIGMAFSLEIKKVKKNNYTIITIENPSAKLLYRYKNNNRFKILFFTDLDDNILPNYQEYFSEKKKLIQSYNDMIKVM